ncbi:MAG: LamG domain-containing protein [Desulfobacteraceae bacterium]|nr:LamG domain-containing protein [Desulfobacteraceae bacterium]
MLDYIKKLITPDMVSLWVPSGTGRAIDLIRGNHGQCYGTHPNVPVTGVPRTLNACDATTDWTGTSLSIDTADKKEGTGSLKDAVASPAADTNYTTIYDPTGSWDWSAKKHILLWLKSDRANTAFTYAFLIIYDTLGNWRYWNLTFSAGEWTAGKLLLSAGDDESETPPDLALINQVRVLFKTADTTPFYKKIDDFRIAYSPSLINPSVGWHFDGVDDYVDCGNDASLTLAKWTMGLWLYRKVDSGTKERLITKSDASAYDYWLHIHSADTLVAGFVDTGSNSRSASTTETVPSVEWVFAIATFDGTYIKVYLNADLDITSADFSAFTPRTSTRSLWLGRLANTYNFNGYVALPFVANAVWSAAQIKNFYNATKGLFWPR